MEGLVPSIISAIISGLVTAIIAMGLVNRSITSVRGDADALKDRVNDLQVEVRCNRRTIGELRERVAKLGG